MWIFYIGALIPCVIGLIAIMFDKHLTWCEWLIGSAAAFIVSAIMHLIAIHGMTSDTETWSGKITKVSHYPRWVETYQESHSKTDSKGHSHTYYTTEYQTHHEHWEATRDFGTYSDNESIESSDFNELTQRFGSHTVDDGRQSCDHFSGSYERGNNRIYATYDNTGFIAPVTTEKSFENRIKAAPTVFSFSKVPTNILVSLYPSNDNWMRSDRLLGTASKDITTYKWDCMNSILGPVKKVNVILVGFDNQSDDYGHYQQAKWIGGKKNDLVICYGGGNSTHTPTWAYVFGWTESELVKENLQTLLMSHNINDSLIPLIQAEVQKNYVIKDWHKFDYITIAPPTWSYWVYFILMIITQSGLYIYFHYHEFPADNGYGQYGRSSYYRKHRFN